MTELVVFDYGQLDVETRIVVRQRTDEIKTLVRRSAQDIIDIGNKLIEIKEHLGHGNFGNWLGEEFGWSWDTANNFMNVAIRIRRIPNGSEFHARALYLLAAPSTPEPARIEAIQRAEAGEPITHTTAKAIVAQHKPTPAPAVPIVEPEPLRAAQPPSRKLSDEEAISVVWRVLERNCDTGKAIMPRSGEMQRDWLVKADWYLFRGALADGVRFDNGQMLRVINNVKDEIESKIAHFAVNFVSKPQPAPAIVEPEAETEDQSVSDEWYTPEYIIEPARRVLGNITLDPASSREANTVIKATTALFKAHDSLQPRYPWLGRVWLNPPYSNPLPWVEKLLSEYANGNIRAALLLVNTTNSPQWARLLWQSEHRVCLLYKRIKFWRPDKPEGKGFDRDQMIWYVGNDQKLFTEVFSEWGAIR